MSSTYNCSIEIGDFDVLSTGSVIVPHNEPIVFKIDSLIFKIIFPLDSVEGSTGHINMHVKQSEDGSSYMEIALYNQDASFFSSSKTLFNLATLSGKNLYLKFCVNSINQNPDTNDEDKIFFYTWYLSKDEQVKEK